MCSPISHPLAGSREGGLAACCSAECRSPQISKHCPYPSGVQSLISAKLLCECRQGGLESNLTSGMLGLLFVLQTLGYFLEATPTIFGCLQLARSRDERRVTEFW